MILSLPINRIMHVCITVFYMLLMLIIVSPTAQASSNVQVSGFATFGLSSENKDDLGFLRDSNQSKDPSRDISLRPDSIIGVQASSAFATNWRATTQLVYRDRPRQGLDEAVELAFLAYRPISSLDMRLGRVAVDMFQLSDYRRVDYANLWVRPPTEVYAWILPSSIDGGDFAYSFSRGSYFWRVKLQYGNTEPVVEFPDGSQVLDTEFNDFLVATVTLDFDAWRTRLSYSQAKTAASSPGFLFGLKELGDIVPGPVGEEATQLASRLLSASGEEVRYTQASLGYDNGDWILDTELASIDTTGALIPTGIAGYLSVGRRFNELTPYAVYSRFVSDQDLYVSTVDWSATGVEGVGLRDAAIASINGVQIEQYTSSLGLRWDIAPKIAFKGQWDRTYIEKGKYAAWAHTNGRATADTTVDLFSFALNFIF